MYYDFIERMRFSRSTSIEQIVCLVVSIVITIISSFLFFRMLDRVPATQEDYNELYEQLRVVEKNPEESLKRTGNLIIYDDKIVYEIENIECKMKGEYTRNFELTEFSQEDKATSLIQAIGSTLIGAALFFFLSFIGVYAIIFLGESLVIGSIFITRKVKKHKSV